MCRAAGCTRSTVRPGNSDRFALCPTCTDRLLAGKRVLPLAPRPVAPPVLAESEARAMWGDR